jgi:hypothetical protein
MTVLSSRGKSSVRPGSSMLWASENRSAAASGVAASTSAAIWLAGSRGLRGLADRVEVAGGTLSVVSPAGGSDPHQRRDRPRHRL